MTEEYLKSDHLSVSVKTDVADTIEEAYRAFGWELAEERDDERYSDITHMNFTRDHFIAGKDRLQLLQVRYDVALNFIGRAKKRVALRAVWLGFFLAVFGIALAVAGGFAIAAGGYTLLTCGVLLISAGAACFVLAALACRRLYSDDKKLYAGTIAVLLENMRAAVEEAGTITGKGGNCGGARAEGSAAEEKPGEAPADEIGDTENCADESEPGEGGLNGGQSADGEENYGD